MTTRIAGSAHVSLVQPYDIVWVSRAISESVGIRDDFFDTPIPPTDSEHFRYIKLTAADPYNEGVLVDEQVTGSGALIVATAKIDLPGSPLHGETVNLWNTERRIPRPGESGLLQNDALQNITGDIALFAYNRQGDEASGAFFKAWQGGGFTYTDGTTAIDAGFRFDASRVARTADETRMKNQGVTYYMRIK